MKRAGRSGVRSTCARTDRRRTASDASPAAPVPPAVGRGATGRGACGGRRRSAAPGASGSASSASAGAAPAGRAWASAGSGPPGRPASSRLRPRGRHRPPPRPRGGRAPSRVRRVGRRGRSVDWGCDPRALPGHPRVPAAPRRTRERMDARARDGAAAKRTPRGSRDATPHAACVVAHRAAVGGAQATGNVRRRVAEAPSQTLRRTPLYDRHVAAAARMVPFAGWEMPVQYGRHPRRARRRADGVGRLRRLAHGPDRVLRRRRPAPCCSG